MPPPPNKKKPPAQGPPGPMDGPRDQTGMMQMPPPGMPRPGQGMDPMMAMLNGLPMGAPGGPPSPPPSPMGPDGFPIGGTSPFVDPNASPNLGGSALLQRLAAMTGQGAPEMSMGDPYDAGPLGHAQLGGMGVGDPGMGLEQILALLALAKSGTGGVPAGGSGVNFDRGNPGIMSTI